MFQFYAITFGSSFFNMILGYVKFANASGFMQNAQTRSFVAYIGIVITNTMEWIYAFIIVWFTFDVTLGFGMKNFNVLPMIIYPFGIALRDYKKKVNLEQAIKTFRV